MSKKKSNTINAIDISKTNIRSIAPYSIDVEYYKRIFLDNEFVDSLINSRIEIQKLSRTSPSHARFIRSMIDSMTNGMSSVDATFQNSEIFVSTCVIDESIKKDLLLDSLAMARLIQNPEVEADIQSFLETAGFVSMEIPNE